MHQNSLPTAIKQINYQDNYEKGKAFEQYIINLFNQHSFQWKKWRESKKFTDQFLPTDHYNPDLEMELVFTGAKKYRFAVECKWRKEFKEGTITWASNSQICSYQIFQSQARMPVFIAIGIGGQPSSPEKLFVTPLDNISQHNYVHELQLIPFKRKPTNRFFYDIRQLKLF